MSPEVQRAIHRAELAVARATARPEPQRTECPACGATLDEFTPGTVDTFRELMNAWDTMRPQWMAFYGSDEGFADWFTAQVLPPVREEVAA